jgi:hypothetical protein
LPRIDTFGRSDGDAGTTQAWNVSLGAPIDAVPLVATAVDLITLAWSTLRPGRAAALLRSRHLPDATANPRGARAAVERRGSNPGSMSCVAGDVVAALEGRDPALARRLSTLRSLAARTVARRATDGSTPGARRSPPRAGRATPRCRATTTRRCAALDEHLVGVRGDRRRIAGARTRRARREEAVVAFAAMARAPAVPARIPGRADPDPRPLRVDRTAVRCALDRGHERRDAGRARCGRIRCCRHAGSASAACRAATLRASSRTRATWCRGGCAPPRRRRESCHDGRGPARHARGGVSWGDAVVLAVPPSHAELQFAARPALERSIDAVAPAVSEAIVERWRAGSGLVAAQSDCPFQALAARRWRADPWPDRSSA